MTKVQIAEGYEHIYGGYRSGSHAKVSDGTHKISVTIKGWLDENLEPTSRKKASYIKVTRWSYGNGDNLPSAFAIVCPPSDPVWPWR